MINIHTQSFDSWDKLTKFIDDNFTYFNHFSYRGHSESNWKLESTLTRIIKNLDINENKVEIAKQHLKNFKINLRGRCNLNLNDISENELFAIGQHFGLYTPLLDWTSSPYVGLYFALNSISETGERCLWAISDNLITEINKSIRSTKNKMEFVKPLTNDNPRLVSQQGLFLKLPIEKSLEELVEKTESKSEGVKIYKLIFHDNIREDSLASLNNMNINSLTLFPDLIGSSLHTNYLLEIKPHLKKRRDEIWDTYKKELEIINSKKNI